MRYRYVLDCAVAESIFGLSGRQRDLFIRFFRALADDPFQVGDETFLDSTGREIQKKRFARWLVSYWPDHAVKEVRIVGVQLATR
ncbi:MAG: hypothetical protein AAB466_00250 [Verrucomicrobiota bacterium]